MIADECTSPILIKGIFYSAVNPHTPITQLSSIMTITKSNIDQTEK